MSDIILAKKPADELAERWEVRALREACGKTAAVVVAFLAAEVPIALPILLQVAFPGFTDISLPAFIGYAQILEDGSVVSNMIDRNRKSVIAKVYDSDDDLRGDFRRLADKIKMTDEERDELFGMLRKWVVGDRRYDHMGEKRCH